MLHKRRWIAVLCIAAVAFAGLSPAASFLFAAILVPLWAVFGLVVSVRIPASDDSRPAPFPFFQPLPSRGPPLV